MIVRKAVLAPRVRLELVIPRGVEVEGSVGHGGLQGQLVGIGISSDVAATCRVVLLACLTVEAGDYDPEESAMKLKMAIIAGRGSVGVCKEGNGRPLFGKGRSGAWAILDCLITTASLAEMDAEATGVFGSKVAGACLSFVRKVME